MIKAGINDEFTTALLSDTTPIPMEDDWFAPLIGDWDFVWTGSDGRSAEGEWFFRRVLEGRAIEDIYICPSRATRDSNPQPDGEYGAAFRMYNKENHCYDMTYINEFCTTRLEVRKAGEKIQCSVISPDAEECNKWVFSEITPRYISLAEHHCIEGRQRVRQRRGACAQKVSLKTAAGRTQPLPPARLGG